MKEIANSQAFAPEVFDGSSFDPPFLLGSRDYSVAAPENVLESSDIVRSSSSSVLAAMIDLVRKQPRYDGKKSRVKKRVVLLDRDTDKKIVVRLSESQLRWIWFYRLIDQGNGISEQINQAGDIKNKHTDEGVVVLGETERLAGLSNQLNGVILDLRVLDRLAINNDSRFMLRSEHGYESLRSRIAGIIDTKEDIYEAEESRRNFFSQERRLDPSWLFGTAIFPRIRPKNELIK